MLTDTEYLQCLGLGLQGLRSSGQFCDAMVCVGSTRILVHKVVLSAASKTLHDMALEFDMTPHRERDQLEIIIPPDVSLYAVNMFINFLYTGQLELNDRVATHIQRLATIFGVSRLLTQCQEYIQRTTAPDSQNLNLSEENQIEPDSSCTNGAQPGNNEEHLVGAREEISLDSSLTRSNSTSSGFGADQNAALGNVTVKSEPLDFATYKELQPLADAASSKLSSQSPMKDKKTQDMAASMTMLEKLMSPVVNIKKLPSNITPDVVVLVSDDENDEQETSVNTGAGQTQFKIKQSHQYTLEEKEAIAIEAKRFGTTHVSNSKNIPLPDILSWMSLFGLRNPGFQKLGKHGKQVNHDADLALVRWIVQQQEMNGSVDLNSMKQYALTAYRQTQPKFVASKTWLGNFLQRNMSILQGTKFVHGEGNQIDVYGTRDAVGVSVKQEVVPLEDIVNTNGNSGAYVLETLGQHTVLENVPLNEEMLINEVVGTGLNAADDDDNDDNSFVTDGDLSSEYMAKDLPNVDDVLANSRTQGTIQTPFGKRPIIIGQAKCFDAKSERKIVQWVLERNARDGYVFTDDFKDYARTLYNGAKYFGATQAWMKKFLRRNRVLKDVKFCSKFKNSYSQEEKVAAVAMARRFGTTYAAKHTGISDKMIHCWRLAVDRGQMSPSASVTNRIDVISPSSQAHNLPTSTLTRPPSSTSLPEKTFTTTNQALHGIVPEFENQIIKLMKEHQANEGSISYDDISKISQSIYKETRPMFKASYSWIRTFLDRHKEEVRDIELENVSKVFVEDKPSQCDGQARGLSTERISEMVDSALKEIEAQETTTNSGNILINRDHLGIEKVASSKRPIVIGPSVMFNRKTEKILVEWALERQQRDGYVFTDDFKEFAKSHHTGPKHFSASSGWMSLFLRRHRVLKDVKWKSKFKNNYTEEEKMAAIAEAKRLGTGHVGRKLGIDPALICAWRIKMEKNAHKQTFWKGTKIRKFGKGSKLLQPKFLPLKLSADMSNDAARGIVPEFEQRIVQMILEQHEKEGSTSYEEMSRISQSVYKETRANFKASYAWIRNFMKRHEDQLKDVNIDNVKKVFLPEDEDAGGSNFGTFEGTDPDMQDFQLEKMFQKRPIIVGQSRSLDTKTEKKLVQWLVEQQEKTGYVFLDQFKTYAQSLYKGEKKFAATQAWRIKFLRRNHAAVKHVKFTSSFRNQYSLEEKKAIVQEAKKFGPAHVAKKTGIDHCLINAWRNKLERSGDIPIDEPTAFSFSNRSKFPPAQDQAQFISKLKEIETNVGPGLYSFRGIVPTFEKKIVIMIQDHMDNEGSVSYQDVSNIARAVYKETRPHFKACYNWIKEFIKRHKKELRHVEFEHSKKILMEDENGLEILIPEDRFDNMESLIKMNEGEESFSKASTSEGNNESRGSWESFSEMEEIEKTIDPMIVIDNPEDPNYESHSSMYGNATPGSSKDAVDNAPGIDITNIASRRPVIIGTPVHFDRKTEKKIVEWLLEKQNKEEFVFTDDFRNYARSLYTGQPGKFAATNAWITKFMRRNRLEKKIRFQSKLKGNNLKYEEKIVELILEHQEKEGSVSNDDIQKITQSVYKQIRPNFRACYNWIRDFIKRHKDELADVELENVKKVFIPDEDEQDGVLIRDFDPMKGLPLEDHADLDKQSELEYSTAFEGENSHDSSWIDLDSTEEFDRSRSHTPQQTNLFTGSTLDKLVNRKRPIIIAPPKTMDIKTEKKLVQWMNEQQEQNGCVYLDLFKEYAKSIHTGPKKFCATQAWMVKFKQRNHQALKNVQIKSRFRKEYTNEEKISAVEEARRFGCHHVGRKLGINGGVIYTWKVQLEQAERVEASHGFGGTAEAESCSRGMIPEFEQTIIDTVLKLQETKGGVTYENISQIARTVYQETRKNFKASNNWVLEFIRRNKDTFQHVNFENQRKFLTEDEKLHILSEEKKYGTDHVVKKRNISASTIYHWKRHMQAKAIPIPKYKALVGSKIKKKYAKGKKLQKTFSTEEKRNVVRMVEEKGFTYASLKVGISRNLIAKWVQYFRDQGEDIVISNTRASTATAKKDLEQQIVTWVLEQNDQLGIVMTNRIQAYARKVFEEAYTKYNATDHWLEGFISQNGEAFENVRFREKGDTDLEFTDAIKLKLSRYAEKYGAVETADKTGLTPKNIYHWRRILRLKGYDLAGDGSNDAAVSEKESATPDAMEKVSPSTLNEIPSQPKSLMQQKLEKIALKYNVNARRNIVAEANSEGASTVASKNKIPLPLLLSWMKMYDVKPEMSAFDTPHSLGNVSRKESTPDSNVAIKLKVRLPSIEKAKAGGYSKHSEDFKREVCSEAKRIGVMDTCRKSGVAYSTLYHWMKEFDRDASIERKSSERSSIESERDTSATPINVSDIKTEPTVFDDSEVRAPSDNVSDLYKSYKPRKYTEEEKMDVVRRAIEIGYKPTSKELEIPVSNVRRWTEMYNKRVKQSEYSEKKKVKYQELKASRRFSQSGSDTDTSIKLNTSDGSGRRISDDVTIIDVEDEHTKSIPEHKRKHIESTPCVTELAKKRRLSSQFSDAEKMVFVNESEILGARAAALSAGVSIDVLYKWRSKFLHKSFKGASSGSDVQMPVSSYKSSTASTVSVLSNLQSSPSICKLLQSPSPSLVSNIQLTTSSLGTQSSSVSDIHSSSSTSSPSSKSFYPPSPSALEIAKTIQLDFGASEGVLQDEDDLMCDTPISQPVTNLVDDSITINIDADQVNMSVDFAAIQQIETSAANQILEMTENYMEAEKAHESNTFGLEDEKVENQKSLVIIPEKGMKEVDTSEIGLIQISNIKSEATIE